MSRGDYKQFQLKDLSGGLNLENSPNEIDNKQCTKSLNFNFIGNKLVSEKIGLSKYTKTNNILGFTEDGDDLLFVEEGNTLVYKNNVRLNTNIDIIKVYTVINTQLYKFTVSDLSNSFSGSYTSDSSATEEEIINGLITSFNSNSSSFYKAGLGQIYEGGVQKSAIFIANYNNNFAVFDTTIDNGPISKQDNEGFYLSSTDINVKTNGGNIYILDNGSLKVLFKNVFGASGNTIECYYVYNTIIVGNFFEIYNGKLFYANKDKLYFSRTSDYTHPFYVFDFSLYDSGIQNVGEGGDITAITSSENGIYVFKDKEIFYSNSTQDDGVSFAFIFNKITNNGTSNYKTIQKIGQEIIYYDFINKKIRRLSYEQNLTTLRDTSISNEVNTILNSIIESNPYITSIYRYPNYRLCYRTASQTYNNKALTYNIDTKSLTETDITVKVGGNNYYIYGTTIYKDNLTNTSSGEFVSKEYDLGDAIDIKRFSEIETYGIKGSGITNLYLDIYQDGELYETFDILDNYPNNNFRQRFDLWTEGRLFKFGLRYVGSGNVEINEVNFRYKPLRNFIDYIG